MYLADFLYFLESWYFIIILGFCVVASVFIAFLLRPSRIGITPANITLTWTDDPRTTQTVTWRTKLTPTPGLIQYSEGSRKSSLFLQDVTAMTAVVQRLTTNVGDISIHSVTLPKLKPGTRYIYRVGDGEIWSKKHQFTTAADNAQSFKFLIFGDTQNSYYLTWRKTLHTAYQTNQDAAFFIHVGDLTNKSQNYKEWNMWFHASRSIIDTIPILPVVGNHETYTLKKKIYSMPTFFTAQFKVPTNGPIGLTGQVYSFDYGNIHFSILDTQDREEQKFEPHMLEKQKMWLANDLQVTDKFWKIVLMHRSPYDNRSRDGNRILREAIVPILDKYKVDIVFSGHDHIYARTYPLRSGSIVKNNIDGTIYITAGRTGKKTYTRTQRKDYNEVFYNLADESNYITVAVNGSTITVGVFKQTGLLLDEWIISK